jgi:arylsulfatase A-like enzyme
MNALVKEGIEMDRHYVYKYCSPTRTAIQSGRNPYHVNPLNAAPEIYNPADPVSGMAAMPRNMTGMAMKMSAGGYKTHMFGKWDVGMATPDHTPHGSALSCMTVPHICSLPREQAATDAAELGAACVIHRGIQLCFALLSSLQRLLELCGW